MIKEKGGWFVRNIADATWMGTPAFGKACTFENPDEPFPEVGIHMFVLEPGKPNCRYHRETAQENFLVLSGECVLLINDEEKPLRPWDFVHCPPNVSHVLVGAGTGPCAVLAIGRRGKDVKLFYPRNERARAHGAEAPEPTDDPRVAYSDVAPRAPTEPGWPV
jgi:uncharacterized cupin superfamily protein